MSIAKTSIAFAFLAAAASLPALLGAALDSGHAPGAPAIEAPAPGPFPGPSQDATPHPAQDRTKDNDGRQRRRAAPPLPDDPWPYGEDGDAIPV